MGFRNIFWRITAVFIMVTGCVYWVYAQGRVLAAGWLLKQDMAETYRLAHGHMHEQDCFVEEVEGLTVGTKGYQLRFENERDYVLEAVCESTQLGSIEVVKGRLKFGVEKVDGAGVMVLIKTERVDAGVILGGEWKNLWVGFDNDGEARIRQVDRGELMEASDDWAKASCQGFGGVCCDGVTSVGWGEAYEASDCNTCHRKCLYRPVTALFTAEPGFEAKARQVVMGGTQAEVGFWYRINDSDGEIVERMIRFGDGEEEVLVEDGGLVEHKYVCPGGGCRYTAELFYRDNDGLERTESRINRLDVVFR